VSLNALRYQTYRTVKKMWNQLMMLVWIQHNGFFNNDFNFKFFIQKFFYNIEFKINIRKIKITILKYINASFL